MSALPPDRQCISITGPQLELRAGQVVICAGAWSGQLGGSFCRPMPVIAERGYHVDLATDEIWVRRPVTAAERKVVLTPLPERTRVTGMVELATADLAPDWARCAWLVRHAAALLPGIDPTPVSRWVGSRPTLPNYLPAIGWDAAHTNVVWATGHQHLGLTLAATTAELVTEILEEQDPSLNLAPFAPSRF